MDTKQNLSWDNGCSPPQLDSLLKQKHFFIVILLFVARVGSDTGTGRVRLRPAVSNSSSVSPPL